MKRGNPLLLRESVYTEKYRYDCPEPIISEANLGTAEHRLMLHTYAVLLGKVSIIDWFFLS